MALEYPFKATDKKSRGYFKSMADGYSVLL